MWLSKDVNNVIDKSSLYNMKYKCYAYGVRAVCLVLVQYKNDVDIQRPQYSSLIEKSYFERFVCQTRARRDTGLSHD